MMQQDSPPITDRRWPARSSILAGSLAVLLALAVPASAETHLRLMSEKTNASVAEGYALSVEQWSAQIEADSSDTDHFWYHWYDEPEIWISHVGTLLYNDADGDGYHAGFSLSFDVDSDHGDYDVYANIYLQPEAGDYELLHRTSVFTVYGNTIGDKYRIDTELQDNSAAGQYQLTIDIHDAATGELLDTADPYGFSNLDSLPLEAASENTGLDNDVDATPKGSIHITEYAGQFGPLSLLLAAMLLVQRTRRKQLQH